MILPAAVCAVMTLAQATAYALHLGLQTSFAPILAKRIAEFTDNGSMLLYIFRPNPGLLLGILVGAVVIRDVRTAAHSQLTDPKALRDFTLAEEEARNRGEDLPPEADNAAAQTTATELSEPAGGQAEQRWAEIAELNPVTLRPIPGQ